MAKRQIPTQKTPKGKTTFKETEEITLDPDLQSVRVWRPKNSVTTVNGVEDIDVRDGSLLLLKRQANGRETCMMVFSPGQWITANIEPVL